MNPYSSFGVYIAGPECFYPRGYSLWHAQRKLAEYYGFTVVLPNDAPLKLDHEDLRLNADAIFANLKKVIEKTDIIIADLELFRGPNADCGVLFELGMAYAKGARLYGYTRDKRNTLHKNQGYYFTENSRGMEESRYYQDLPFAPSLTASTMIVEGDFYDCLKTVMLDLDEQRKRAWLGIPDRVPFPSVPPAGRSSGEERRKIFLSTPVRSGDDGPAYYERLKACCAENGLEGLSPLDGTGDFMDESGDPLERACRCFALWQEQIRSCDIFLGDLDNFQGWEPNNDVAFEAGAAWKYGKVCYACMDDIRPMRDKLPNKNGLDPAGNVVENFDYPVNLMFSCSMPVLRGNAEDAIKQIAGQRR
ncbi:MAG: nucleoside 2-deoxyribosyltransferase [Treponema sp.]|jgi:nucleoside 2-deoxyribosyltransferase|nr:nucleoside 2-deoxyribosyltransferase [Treponema sp.]